MHRRRFLCLGLLLLLGPWTMAADAPANAKPRALRDLPYVTNGTPRQRLDLYLPAADHPPLPVLVWIHGGGWIGGSKNGCPAVPMVNRGYAVVSVEYRFSKDAIYPAQIEDCKAAIRWLRAHAVEYGLDPKRIGVWGASAGGHLVALLGTTGQVKDFDKGENLEQSSAVQCVIDWFGPTDFLHYGDASALLLQRPDNLVALLLGGPVADRQELARQASPVYFVSKDSAPFLIMQGDQDPLVPVQQSQLLHDALVKAGVESTLKIMPGAAHGGVAFNAADSLKLMADFVEKHIGGS